MDLEFKVITLNCWGIPFVSKDRKDRMQAIAEFLSANSYDVVCLQEVWSKRDFNLIKDQVAGVLPYAHYFYSGVVGSGICILSKHSMEEVFFHQWPVNGYMHKVHHGDWFGGKGIGLCQLRVNNFTIHVYSAHLHAEYNRDCDEYKAHRVLQAYDTAQFIQLTSRHADVIILAGDLNTEPGDLAYRLLLSVPGLQDTFTVAGQIADDMTATNECLNNSYTSKELIKNNIPGKRIDYIMYHTNDDINVTLNTFKLPLPKLVPNKKFSYSDHEAVSVSLQISRSKCPRHFALDDVKKSDLNESIVVFDESLKKLENNKIMFGVLTFCLLILLIVSLCIDIPYGYQVLYFIFKILLTVCMLYTFIMGTFWNQIEKHAIIASKLAIEVTLKKIKASKDM